MNEDRLKVETTPSGKPVTHGRASTYNNLKCRCAECTKAWAEYMKPRVKKFRADKKKETGVKINL